MREAPERPTGWLVEIPIVFSQLPLTNDIPGRFTIRILDNIDYEVSRKRFLRRSSNAARIPKDFL